MKTLYVLTSAPDQCMVLKNRRKKGPHENEKVSFKRWGPFIAHHYRLKELTGHLAILLK
jgi:hypothetical protein